MIVLVSSNEALNTGGGRRERRGGGGGEGLVASTLLLRKTPPEEMHSRIRCKHGGAACCSDCQHFAVVSWHRKSEVGI